jgi:hypothetical protein
MQVKQGLAGRAPIGHMHGQDDPIPRALLTEFLLHTCFEQFFSCLRGLDLPSQRVRRVSDYIIQVERHREGR